MVAVVSLDGTDAIRKRERMATTTQPTTLLSSSPHHIPIPQHRSHPRFDCLPTAATLDTLLRESLDMELFELASEVGGAVSIDIPNYHNTFPPPPDVPSFNRPHTHTLLFTHSRF